MSQPVGARTRPGVFLHVGLQRAASTWLQQSLLPRVPGVDLLTPMDGRGKDLSDALKADRPDAARVTRLLTSARPVIVSNEVLTGGIVSSRAAIPRYVDALMRAVPDAKVLVVVRRQRDWLVSVWSRYVQGGGTCSLADFCSGRHSTIGFRLDDLMYDDVCARYARFGGGLTVLPYELLASDPKAYISAIARFLEISPDQLGGASPKAVNAAAGIEQVSLFQQINGMPVMRAAARLSRLTPRARGVRRYLQAALARRYQRRGAAAGAQTLAALDSIMRERHPQVARSNTALATYCAFDLRAFDYVLE